MRYILSHAVTTGVGILIGYILGLRYINERFKEFLVEVRKLIAGIQKEKKE